MEGNKKNYFKFSLILILCLFIRLIPFRVPNVEPIMASVMPFGRAYGAWAGFSFALLSILLYDVLTGTIGVHTFFTATAYGLIGLWSASYFSAKGGAVSDGKNDIFSYVRFAIIGTLFYDIATGLTVGPIFFHQSFLGSLIGQIPFTALHLTGNIILALTLSPAIYYFLIRKKKLKDLTSIKILNPKII
jgi:hypothetical protein